MAKQRTRKNVAMVTIEAEVVLPDDPIQSAEALLEVNASAENAAAMFSNGRASIRVISRKAEPFSDPMPAPVSQAV